MLGLLLLPFLLPIIGVLCWIVRRDGAPGLFLHTRIGREGRPFSCFKIRTMLPDAEELLAEHLASNQTAAEEWQRTQKLTNDPRTTPIGRILRKTSLDELPQIWNVLRGDMSFVGPRPITQNELARYGLYAPQYLSLKPGITGHWQVYGRENGCYTERLRLDTAYAQKITLALDLSLIVRTALLLFIPSGR